MQWCIFSTKQTDDVIIIITNILQEINYQKPCHSTQYINYRCKKNIFYCFYLCLLKSTLSFLHKNDHSQTYLRSTFIQRIAIHMRMHTHGPQMMVTEISKTTNFWAHFFYNMFLYWIVNPIHQYNVILLASFFQVG